jgi:hypothetical protein
MPTVIEVMEQNELKSFVESLNHHIPVNFETHFTTVLHIEQNLIK